MTSINLLPQELRKEKRKTKQIQRSSNKGEIEFMRHKSQTMPSAQQGRGKLELKPRRRRTKSFSVQKTAVVSEGRKSWLDDLTVAFRQKRKIVDAFFRNLRFKNLKEVLSKTEGKKTQPKQSKKTSLSVDLLKGEITIQRSPKPELIKLFILIIIILLLAGGAALYYRFQYKTVQQTITQSQQELDSIESELSSMQAMIDNLKDSDVLINSVYTLIKHRINWVAFLDELEQKTLKNVYYTQLDASGVKNISISARAQNVEDALLQVKIFKESADFAVNTELESIGTKEEAVRVQGKEAEEVLYKSFVEFSFTFDISPEWIKKQEM